jgi:hypothetical protein
MDLALYSPVYARRYILGKKTVLDSGPKNRPPGPPGTDLNFVLIQKDRLKQSYPRNLQNQNSSQKSSQKSMNEIVMVANSSQKVAYKN